MYHKCSCGWNLHANAPARITCGQCGRQYTIDDSRLVPVIHGLGDYIATLTRYTGIAWLTKKLTRGKCGCNMRQARLNTLGSRLYAKAMSLWRDS